jgi:hypothetical protein
LWWVLFAFLGGIAAAVGAEELLLRAQGTRLDFTAPRIHYLTGRALTRLHRGEGVAFDIQVTLSAGSQSNTIRKNTAQFLISYDVWGERFQVAKVLPDIKKVDRLTANEAEAWCIQEMSMEISGVASNQPLWAHMDIRAEGEREQPLFGRGNITDNGISLTSLIERFSKLPPATQPHWSLDTGPVTLEQLRRGG